MRHSRIVSLVALLVSLSAGTPAFGAWSGDCAPPSAEPQLSGLGSVVDQARTRIGSITRVNDVHGMKQPDGEPECGPYAAAMVITYYEGYGSEAAYRLADGMAREAKEKGVLHDKDGMSTRNLARLVRSNGYRTRTKSGATMDDLIRAIEAGRPPIVLFEVDKRSGEHRNGKPATEKMTNGDKKESGGHFAVIESVYTDENGKRWLMVQHGWRERPYIFSEEDFVKSWKLHNGEMIEIQNPYEQRASR